MRIIQRETVICRMSVRRVRTCGLKQVSPNSAQVFLLCGLMRLPGNVEFQRWSIFVADAVPVSFASRSQSSFAVQIVWILDSLWWILDYGFSLLDYGLWIPDYGFTLDSYLTLMDSGFRILDSGKVTQSGFWIRNIGYQSRLHWIQEGFQQYRPEGIASRSLRDVLPRF